MVYWNVKKHGVHWVTHRYLHVSDQVLSDLLSEPRVRLSMTQ